MLIWIYGSSFNEAEASLPRNTMLLRADLDSMIKASMRPRQACLGIRPKDAGYFLSEINKASMRPRQACLGILRANQIGGGDVSVLQ